MGILSRGLDEFDWMLLHILRQSPSSGRDMTVRLPGGSNPRRVRAVYAHIHRLQRLNLITSEWSQWTDNRINSKTYRLTATGYRRPSRRDGTAADTKAHVGITTLLVCAVLSTPDAALGGSETEPHLEIVFENTMKVPTSELRLTVFRLAEMFSAVGIHIDGVPQSGARNAPATANASPSALCLVTAALTADSVEVNQSDFGVLAFITPAGMQAKRFEISYARVREFALLHRMPFSQTLAAVIAHELGHLFLLRDKHAKWGLMQQYWNPASSTTPLDSIPQLSAMERKLMRNAVARCEPAQ